MARQLYSLLVALVFSLVTSIALADCDNPFENPDEVLDLHLQLSRQQWVDLQSSQKSFSDCDDQYPYFEVQFRCGDQEWIDIGVRRRRDRSQTLQKLPLKFDFNRVDDSQRWPLAMGKYGLRSLSLNSGQPDDAGGPGSSGSGSNTGVLSAMLTEHLAWRLMKEEIPEAGNVGFSKLTLHFSDTLESVYQGLYITIENIDRTAIKTRFTAKTGSMYKTTDVACRDKVVFSDVDLNSTTDAFKGWLQINPDDFVGTWFERSNQAVHMDSLFRQEALRELFVNTADTILGIGSNYVALDLLDARRMYFPWDLDDMFRPQPQIRDPETPLVQSCFGTGSLCGNTPLGINTRAHQELRPRYLQTLCRLTNGVGEENKVLSQLNELDELVRPLIADEVPVLWLPAGVDPLDSTVLGTYAAEVERMQEWIPARVEAVRSLIEAEGVSCEKGCVEGSVVECDFQGCPSKRECSGGSWNACEVTPNFAPGSIDLDCDGVPEYERAVAPETGGGSAVGSGEGSGESASGGASGGSGSTTGTETGGGEPVASGGFGIVGGDPDGEETSDGAGGTVRQEGGGQSAAGAVGDDEGGQAPIEASASSDPSKLETSPGYSSTTSDDEPDTGCGCRSAGKGIVGDPFGGGASALLLLIWWRRRQQNW